jgi:hypothetical protein
LPEQANSLNKRLVVQQLAALLDMAMPWTSALLPQLGIVFLADNVFIDHDTRQSKTLLSERTLA